MSKPRTSLSIRVMAEIESYEERRTARRRAVVGGGALLVVGLLAWTIRPTDRVLSIQGSEGAVASLDSSSATERARAYSVLGSEIRETQDPRLTVHLLDGLSDANPMARGAAFEAVCRSNPSFEGGLRDALAAMSDALGAPLELEVASADAAWDLLADASSMSADEQVYSILWLIERLGPLEGAPYLDFALERTQPGVAGKVRSQALRTTLKIYPQWSGMPGLIESCLSIGGSEEKVAALIALDLMQFGAFVPQVRSLLVDPDPSVRSNAILTLLRFDDHASTPQLLNLVDDPNPLVQIHAAYTLVRFEYVSHADRLVAWAQGNLTNPLSSIDPVAEALGKLIQLGDPRASEIAADYLVGYANGSTREYLAGVALEAILVAPPENAEQLLTPLLAEGNDRFRVDTAVALVRLGSSAGSEALHGFIAGVNVDEAIQRYAIRAAGQLGDPSFVPALEVIQSEVDETEATRDEAGRAIEAISGEGGV